MSAPHANIDRIQSRRVVLVVYDGFQLLDMAGPASVFEMANWVAQHEAYDIVVASARGGMIRAASPPCVESVALGSLVARRTDTILVVGGRQPALGTAAGDKHLCDWLCEAAERTERIGSVCTGSFILGAAGLLDQRRAATHWDACRDFRKAFPHTNLEADSVYVQDGNVWTSAGVTTGIDLCLAMVEADLGNQIMGVVAKRLVVYSRRNGEQSQFSPLLDAQNRTASRFSNTLAWVDANLHRQIRVEDMAEVASLTERTFFRRFTEEMGMTPSKYVETARLTRARQLLERGVAVKDVSGAVGFRSVSGFRSAYQQRFKEAPSRSRARSTAG